MHSVKLSTRIGIRARQRLRALKPRAMVGGLGLVYGFLMASAVMMAAAPEAYAVRVTMKRVLFEGSKRADILILINNTGEEMAYRMSWRRMRMTEDKSVVPLEDDDPGADLKPADDMVVYAPRRVVLPPGGSQQVRLMLRKPKGLADGEYRSHFWIEPEEEAVKFDPSKFKGDPTKGPAVQIKMLTGITLPVIVRVGDLSAKAGIHTGAVKRKGSDGKATFVLTREGNRSLYGDMEFTCGSTVVGQVRGIAVYTEVTKRNLDFDLKNLPADCTTVNVTYRAAQDDAQFTGGVMAEAALPVQ
jgi:hypothetical protein